MTSEKAAREQIVKDWQSFRLRPPTLRDYDGIHASYIEWLTCLEMEQQVNELRKQADESSKAETNL
jgi:hypothetical protein